MDSPIKTGGLLGLGKYSFGRKLSEAFGSNNNSFNELLGVVDKLSAEKTKYDTAVTEQKDKEVIKPIKKEMIKLGREAGVRAQNSEAMLYHKRFARGGKKTKRTRSSKSKTSKRRH